jgi:hypothetical protein
VFESKRGPIALHCPVIEFATTSEHCLSFFGWPLAHGDHIYSQSTFSTKAFSSGLVFKGYMSHVSVPR